MLVRVAEGQRDSFKGIPQVLWVGRVKAFLHGGFRWGFLDLEDGLEIVVSIGFVFSTTSGLVKFQKRGTFELEECEAGHQTIRQDQPAMIDRLGDDVKDRRDSVEQTRH